MKAPITLTKTEAVVITIWSCVALSYGSDMYGYVADVLLAVGGAGVCAALILPTNREHGDE